MTVDALRDVRTLPGGQFMSAVIDAVEREALTKRRREETAVQRGQVAVLDNVRDAALLAAAAEMLVRFRGDGETAAANGKEPSWTLKQAVTAGKAVFAEIDKGAAA